MFVGLENDLKCMLNVKDMFLILTNLAFDLFLPTRNIDD